MFRCAHAKITSKCASTSTSTRTSTSTHNHTRKHTHAHKTQAQAVRPPQSLQVKVEHQRSKMVHEHITHPPRVHMYRQGRLRRGGLTPACGSAYACKAHGRHNIQSGKPRRHKSECTAKGCTKVFSFATKKMTLSAIAGVCVV